MPRHFAFVYAVGDARHIGEIKIGEMGALSREAALAKLISRYNTYYGRALRIYKLVPVGVPKRQAEGVIKQHLAAYHVVNELYDLPVDPEEFDSILDSVYDSLAVDFALTHYVEKPSALDRKEELRVEREAVNDREAERLENKRLATAEREELDYERAIELHERAEALEAERAWAATYKRLKTAPLDLLGEGEACDEVEAWRRAHVQAHAGSWLTVHDAFASFQATGSTLGTQLASATLVLSAFWEPTTFAQQKPSKGRRARPSQRTF